MAKYVCDFAQVKEAGEKLCKVANDLSSAVNTYSSTVESSLSSWAGDAESAFSNSNAIQVSEAISNAQYINELGEFVKCAAESIESLEEQLAALSI